MVLRKKNFIQKRGLMIYKENIAPDIQGCDNQILVKKLVKLASSIQKFSPALTGFPGRGARNVVGYG